jgi:hypothetical protein
MTRTSNRFVGTLKWRDGSHTCALSDSERHLGHLFESEGKWTAFDATRPNRTKTGPKRVGVFDSLEQSRRELERALGLPAADKVRFAGG